MQVLEKGRPQKGWSKEIVCTGAGNGNGGCGARLLVEQDDLFKTTSSCRDEVTTYITIRCSECSVMTDLANNEYGLNSIPSHVWSTTVRGIRHPGGGYCHPKDCPN